MRKVLGVGAALLLLLAVAGLAAAGENRNYSVHLNGDTEVPANASLATGQAIFNLSPGRHVARLLAHRRQPGQPGRGAHPYRSAGRERPRGRVPLRARSIRRWDRERRDRGGRDHRGESRRAACRTAVGGAHRCSELGQRVRQRAHERRRPPCRHGSGRSPGWRDPRELLGSGSTARSERGGGQRRLPRSFTAPELIKARCPTSGESGLDRQHRIPDRRLRPATEGDHHIAAIEDLVSPRSELQLERSDRDRVSNARDVSVAVCGSAG
jgi:hypothetical protein